MHHMPDEFVARPVQLSPVRPGQGHGGQSEDRSRDGLKLLTHLSPQSLIALDELKALTAIGLDGWRLFTLACTYVSEEVIDYQSGFRLRALTTDMTLQGMEETLVNDLLDAAEHRGQDAEALRRLEASIEEYIPAVMKALERIVNGILDLISQLTPPQGCLQSLENYLTGYTPLNNYSGYLHFRFNDEDHHSF